MTAKDRRLYGKMTIGYTNHRKIFPLSDAAFRCWHEALDYCRDQQTDGLLARRYALARWSPESLRELCENDPEKPSLIEREDGWYIRDYTDHNDSKAEIEARSERNRQAGKQGGLAKGQRTAKRVASEALSESLADKEEDEAKEGGGNSLPPRCSRHPNGNPKDEPCVGCGRVREWLKARQDELAADELNAKRQAREIAENCPDCNGSNLIDVGQNEAAKCLHPYALQEAR